MHRSGTSMLTRALHDAGLHLIGQSAEELISAAEDNPEGFWENKAIVACNDQLLEATGGSWDRPPALPPQGADDPRVAGVLPAAEAALAGLREHGQWGFKDPRLCLTAPFWLDLQPDLRFVICLRHPLEVALSLKRRNRNSYSLGLALWERYYATVLAAVPPERRLVSHYDSFFAAPEEELARVCEFAQLRPMLARVRRDLRHHTIDVSLSDAGVSPSLQALYATLCREARVTIPSESPSNEGRIRRLVLDGAVAERHAEQRLVAIERLEAREREFRAEHGANEEALRNRIRDLERQLSETRAVALRRMDEMARQLQVVHHEVSPGPVRKFARRAVRKSARVGRRAAVETKRSVIPVARRSVQQLPDLSQEQLRRARRGGATPGASAPADRTSAAPVAASARSRVRSAARRLPPPAEQRLRTTWRRVRRAQAAPIPTARRAVARMPEPAQDVTRQIWRNTADLRRRGTRLRRRARATITAKSAPKGAPHRLWKDRYRELVHATVPPGAPWLAVSPGSPAAVRDAASPPATRFPDTPRGAPLGNDLSHIAHLEALRYAGNRFLVVPEGSRPWFRRQAELREHVVSSYHCIADEPDAGTVFDLDAAAGAAGQSLRNEIQRLTGGSAHTPAVLDWTELDIAGELPGVTTFRAPGNAELAYLDRSIELVVRDEDHDESEARRVATLGVVTVAGGPGGIAVRSVEKVTTASAATASRVLVRSNSPAPDDAWARLLTERVARAGADLELGPVARDAAEDSGEHDIVIVLEPFVLPLPGAIETAAALAMARPDTAVTGKVLRAGGRLDSAGGTVFSDRSVALIAEGSEQVRAPWHDYSRAVCWAPGLVAASASLWSTVPGPSGVPVRSFVREWCAAVWAHGGSVVYEPTVVAVRVAGTGGEPSVPLQASAWQRVLDLRPRRPEHLGDGEWRYLLAHDDVEACRG